MLRILTTYVAAVVIGAVVIGSVLMAPANTYATTYGSPALNVDKGQIAPGIGLSDDREELFLDWGLSEAGILRLLVGVVDLGRDDGTEFGVGYRHKSGKRAKVGDADLRLGGLAIFRAGEADNTAGQEYTQIDLGFGGATSVAENLDAYAIAIYRRISLDNPGGSTTDSDVGVVLGGEFLLGDSLLVGGEFHLAIDGDDFAFYAQFKF